MKSKSKTDWALGLPRTATRRFTPTEVAQLRYAVMRMRMLTLGVWIAHPTSWVIFVKFAALADPNNSLQQGLLTVVALSLVAIALPAIIVLSRDWTRRSKGLSGDIKTDFVNVFTGPLTEEATYDPSYDKLLARGPAPSDDQESWTVEILPVSHRIWAVNGQPVKPWLEARVAEVANAPSIAPPKAVVKAQTDTQSEIDPETRRLTDEELDELGRHAKHAWTKPLPWAIGLSIWIAMPIAMLIIQGHLDRGGYYVQFVAFSIATLWAYGVLINGIILARKFMRDRDRGELIILRMNDIDFQHLSTTSSTTPKLMSRHRIPTRKSLAKCSPSLGGYGRKKGE